VEIATGKVTEYNWDYRNRLSSVVFKDSGGNVVKSIAYSYDVNDRRIGKTIDGVVAERYVYDGTNIALVFDGTGNQTHRYLYGTEVDQILADATPTQVLWALTDRLDSVRDLVDQNGVVLDRINYDSFGRVVSQTNANVEFRYGYTGREQDTETGLDYYRARYYDPTAGAFISEDPIGFAAGDTNIYRYVGNSPTNFTDPSGKNPAIVIGGLGVLLFGGTLVGIGYLGTKKQIDDAFNPTNKPIQQSNSLPIDRKPRPVNPTPAIPRAGYCNDEPPPECEPDPGKEVAEQITTETLKNLLNQASNFHKIGSRIDNKWGENNKVVIGISESGKKYITTTSGRFPSSPTTETYRAISANALERRGYIVVKTAGTGENWHAEGRLIQNGINNNDRIVAIGVSDKLCADCASDIKRFNIKTLNGQYTRAEYTRFPKNRPDPQRVKFTKPGSKKKC
jgi:RHS repeat-associated protein